MTVSFLYENVDKKISLVNHAVSSRSQLPVLLNFLLSAEKGKFKISATDLEMGIEVNIPANIEEEGQTTVPAKIFTELLGGLGRGKVKVFTKEQNLHLETEKIKTTFQTIKPDEFPKIYEDKGDLMGDLTAKEIEEILPSVVFAASQDAGRPALSGVLIEKGAVGKKAMRMVATDGYRLSLSGSPEEEESERFLVPARVIREVLFLKEGESVKFYVSKKNNQILFEQGDSLISGRLIEDKFPQYQKIIPQDFSARAQIDKAELLAAVKACAIFARESANIMKFAFEKNKLTVSASAPSLGETSIDVDISFEGEENEIAFNVRYVTEFLSNVSGEKIIFEMSGPLNPGVFKTDKDPNYLHIIMPIRIQG